MAIIARWRMPPENSCGNASTRALGVGDADQVEQLDGPGLRGLRLERRGRAAQRLGDLVADRCRPGSARDSGSWKIIADRLPRSLDSSRSSLAQQLLAVEAGSIAGDPGGARAAGP